MAIFSFEPNRDADVSLTFIQYGNKRNFECKYILKTYKQTIRMYF